MINKTNDCFQSLREKSKIHLTDINELYNVLSNLDLEFDKDSYNGSYEELSAVKSLCDFWNRSVPKTQHAQCIKVYWCSFCGTSFDSGDPEEPNLSIERLESIADNIIFIENVIISTQNLYVQQDFSRSQRRPEPSGWLR